MSLLSTLKFITTHPFNQDAKFKAIVRFAKWQIGSRLLRGEIVYDWINDSKFLVRTGETGLTGNIYTGLHEFPDMGFLLHVLTDKDLFIDVGANVGSYTILACAAIGANGYAFEPVPSTFQRLVENIRLNHLENRVKYLNIGIGREKSVIKFTGDMDTVNHALAEGEKHAHAISVEVSTLDAVLKGQSPSLLKIDVEGYETPVLEGASETLKKPTLHSVIMELNGSGRRYNYDESRILELMSGYGFKSYSYDPFHRNLINLNGKNLNSGNTLFIRDEKAVLERLRNSPMITVHGKRF
jgi:FkbM family methyltransferase